MRRCLPTTAWLLAFLLASPVGAEMKAGGVISEEALKIRDPFKRPVAKVSLEKPKSDLEKFAAEKFSLIGVITGPSKTRAMLLAPNNKTYFVSENMKIGQRKGVIRKISAESVMVRERVVNVLGQEESVDFEIKLKTEGAGSEPAADNGQAAVPAVPGG